MGWRTWWLPAWFYHYLLPLRWWINIPPFSWTLWGWYVFVEGTWWRIDLNLGLWVLTHLVRLLGIINSTADYVFAFVTAARTIAEDALHTVNDYWQGLPGVWRDLLGLPFRLWDDIWSWWSDRWSFIEAWFIIRRWELRQLWEQFTRDYVAPVWAAFNAAATNLRDRINAVSAAWQTALGTATTNLIGRIDAVDIAWRITTSPLTLFYNNYRYTVALLHSDAFDFVLTRFFQPAVAQFTTGFETGMRIGEPPAPPGNGAGPPGIIEYAMQFIGRRYIWGGNGPDVFDCSGYVKFVWERFGKILPRTCQTQFNASTPRSPNQPGDLVFFQFEDEIDHVGLYTGTGDTMIHASSRNGYVKTDTITDLGWWPFYKGTRQPM